VPVVELRNVVILGSTGSIGTQAIDVVRSCHDRFRVIGLSAHRRWREVFAQAQEVRPRWVALTDTSLEGQIDCGHLDGATTLVWGEAGVDWMVSDPQTDIVVSAMVGAAGLRGTLAAIQAGKRIALANKETMVIAGPLVTELARKHGSEVVPVDSEHSAVFQCLKSGRREDVARIILTASGGPFRTTPLAELAKVTVEDALKHPTWQMGPKITIDSATMMNKGLEVIEARWLFDLPPEKIDVVIHRQSMVHALVEYADGSVLAQVSPPDMRLPIQYAMTYPARVPGPSRRLDLSVASRWDFEPVDPERYPAIRLAYEAARLGGTSGAALNAANEVAVARFFAGTLRFSDIVRLCAATLRQHPFDSRPDLEDLRRVDDWSRKEAERWRP
jgi:1-deoxy-D-xylulose-5-phosphate reductoisomerase